MAKFRKPDRSNRKESVQELWGRLALQSVSSPTIDLFEHYCGMKKVPQASVAALQIAHDLTCQALAARWMGGGDASRLLRRAFATIYWRTEFELAYRRFTGVSDLVRDDGLYDMLDWQGLAAACGDTWFSEWIAPYLHNLFQSGGVAVHSREFTVDVPARMFTELLQSVLVKGRWPSELDSPKFGSFAPLLLTIDNADSFRAALVDYCDFRVAQSFGFDGIDATRRRSPNEDASIFDRGGWNQILPTELFTLQHAYRLASGRLVSLAAPHPLLHTPLMVDSFPQLSPVEEDVVASKLQGLAAATFGPIGRPRTPVVPRFL